MSYAIDKIKEGFSEFEQDFNDLDIRCNMLESKLRGMQDDRDKFLTELSLLIEQYGKKNYF